MTKELSITLTPEIFDFYLKLSGGNHHRIFIRNPKTSDTEQIYKILLGRCHEKKTYIQCGRKRLKDSINIIHTGLINAIHEMEMDNVFTWSQENIRHPNGSIIVFSGIRKRGNIQIFDRIHADIFYGEHAHEFPDCAFCDLGATIMMVPGVMIFTGNLEKKKDPFWKFSEIFREKKEFSDKAYVIDIPE